MAGFASFGMPMGNDNSAAAQKARKEGLARIALAKKSGYKGGNFIGGKSGPIMESTSVGDFANRLGRYFTVDVGDATSRTIQDTFLGGKGKSNVLDYSLLKPDTGFGILDAAIKYNPTNLLAGNLLNNPDFSQMLAPGDIIPVQKVASLGLKGAKIAAPSILKGIKGAAERTSPDALSAASGGLLRGSPVRAARSAPEPDEFDKIINAAKAEDPTLGDVAPEGTAPAPFRSDLDWDESMSVNYAKAVKKIIDDLEPSYQKLLDDGEDAKIIYPLVDDSIAALDSEIGNLTMRRYNHNDLEDFLGRFAAPDDYIVADGTLAKRADELVHEIGVEYERWGADPEVWLRETGRERAKEVRGLLDSVDMGASKPVSEAASATREAAFNAEQTQKATQQLDIYNAVEIPATKGGGNTTKGILKGTGGGETRQRKIQNLLKAPFNSKVKPTGNDINNYNIGTLMKRLERANERAGVNNNKIKILNTGDFDINKGIGNIDPNVLNEMRSMIAKAKDRYRSIWDKYGIDGFDLSHLVALDKGGPNVWSNLELLPRKLNVEQLTAPYFAYSRGLTGRGEKSSLLSGIASKVTDVSPSQSNKVQRSKEKLEGEIKDYLVKAYGASDPITKDKDVVEWIKEASIAGKAEKASDPSTWTTAQRAAYDAGDWRTFSSLRGYTPDEIAQFEKYMMLSEKIAKKYEQDGVSLFDPDLEKFLKTL